jgi:hypothetical protein
MQIRASQPVHTFNWKIRENLWSYGSAGPRTQRFCSHTIAISFHETGCCIATGTAGNSESTLKQIHGCQGSTCAEVEMLF